ncbi:hypothetical protein HYDPIDRAFT_141338 [Hydnomerulius pinastri MD-312]|uniref:Uncharacterized protein n=1 Tax=Hydnomerulius pinastri MD-312 TaxID=994086 RepID=A0A0C9W855_9AGAM|nr:hypothetical protein HYDPIDRAFT_119246 [Hydnomerulius pinastri MD-312]KIJ58784.1 hypothetical protein HYDPIDRAFT_141338 [Hydnomerulius pinastri MD-312]
MSGEWASGQEADIKHLALKEARRDGMFAGLTSGLTGALLGSKLMGFSRNKTIFSGVLTGLLSGYFFMQAFEASNMARIKSQHMSSAHGEKSPLAS